MRVQDDDDLFTKDALNGDISVIWMDAVRTEVQTLEHLQCWKIVRREPNDVLLHSKKVLKRKRNVQGSVER